MQQEKALQAFQQQQNQPMSQFSYKFVFEWLLIINFLPLKSTMQHRFQTQNARMPDQNDLPRSSCSIEQAPHALSSKNIYPAQPTSMPAVEERADKSMKYIADRFFPVRKMPCSAKDLFIDSLEWMEDEENEGEVKRGGRRGMTVKDVYKMEVLGDGNLHRDNDIETFSNQNFLKYSYKDENKSENDYKQLFSRGLLSFPEEHLPLKRIKQRKISKMPTKVLDAPALYDDFYLNLVDWSASNLLAVGLSNSVYLWNAGNSKVVRLAQLGSNDLVTSCSSSPSSNVLGVGTHLGEVQLWDCIRHKKISASKGHTARVGAIAWNSNNIFASGSRDKNILVRDIRVKDDFVNKMVGHKQEVCGLKWSFDQQQLASGGNDNRLNLWSLQSSSPTFSLLRHTAAVKALAWSPHQHGLLVSGGGTADRTIRFWNSITGEETKCLNVGSQVCNLMFARTVNELVSTHGYSLNEINIWKMPNMDKIQTLTGHTYRVLYLAMNPDGTTIVTGAGDETLRFWNVFPKKEKEGKDKSNLSTDSICLR